MAAADLKVSPSLSDLLGQLFPPVLNEPSPYDLDEFGLIGDRQFVNGIQELCKVHPVLSSLGSWIV